MGERTYRGCRSHAAESSSGIGSILEPRYENRGCLCRRIPLINRIQCPGATWFQKRFERRRRYDRLEQRKTGGRRLKVVKAKRYLVRGQVQGVGYRYFVQRV